MPTLTVVKHFDVIKNFAAGFFPRHVDLFILSARVSVAGRSILQPHYHDSYRGDSYCLPDRVISGTTAAHGLCTDSPERPSECQVVI